MASTAALSALFGLDGRIAIVTGGGSGIGAGISCTLARAGATVVVVDRDRAAADRIADEIGGTACPFDISEERAVIDAFAGIVAQHGAPWLLVNCAAVQNRVRISESTSEDWDRFHQVNVRGSFLCLREAAAAMVAAGRGGRIVNISSLSAIVPMMPGLTPYAASKSAVLGLTRGAAFEYAEFGITVNAVLPGGVDTPGGRGASGTPPAGPGAERHPPPLGSCTPEDIAAAVLYLGSPAAGRISAQSIIVDGGWLFG